MIKLNFTAGNPSGIDIETAGKLVKEVIGCSSKVTIRKGEKSGDAKLIFHVLSLSVKENDAVELTVEGEEEEEDAKRLEAFIKENI